MTMRYMPWVQAAHSYDPETGTTIRHGLVMGIADIDGKKHFSIQPRGNWEAGWCPSYFYNSVSLAQSRYCDVTFTDVALQEFPSDWESTEYYWGAYFYDESTGIYHSYFSYEGSSGMPCWCDGNNNELSKADVENIINQTHTFEHRKSNLYDTSGTWLPEGTGTDYFRKALDIYLGVKSSASGTIYHEYFNDDWTIYEYEEIDASQVPEKYRTQISRHSRSMHIKVDLWDGYTPIPSNNFPGWGVNNEDVVPETEQEPTPDGGNIVVTITLDSDFHGSGLYLNNDFYTQNYWIFQKIIAHNPLPCDIHLWPVSQQENFINSFAIYYETTYYGYHISYAKMGAGGFVSIDGREDVIDYTPYSLPY